MAAWVAWLVAVALAVRFRPDAFTATIGWLRQHSIVLAGVCGVLSGVVVLRRRASNREESRRSWTAALPIDAAAARWQAFAIETLPAVQMACLLTVVFVGVSGGLLPWAATIGGVAVGAVVSYLMPLARPEYLPEGSRYVPHRRRAGARLPVGSLSALGFWPVRQMFASARPKAVARAIMPILMLMPLGTQADAALLVLGVSAVIGALVLLVSAVSSVSRTAVRWLQPLPLAPATLAQEIATPALIVICCGAAIQSGLLALMGASAFRCVEMGAAILFIGVPSAIAAVLAGLLRAARVTR